MFFKVPLDYRYYEEYTRTYSLDSYQDTVRIDSFYGIVNVTCVELA